MRRHDAGRVPPLEGLARLALAPAHGAVEEDGGGNLAVAQDLKALRDAELGLAIDGRGGRELDGLDHGQVVAREVLRLLLSVELQGTEPRLCRYGFYVRRGVVPENAHGRHERPGGPRECQRGPPPPGGRRLQVARRLLHEDEAESVGPSLDGAARVRDGGDPAHLDPDHPRVLPWAAPSSRASSRTLAGTSWARTSPSPTRTACAPARTTCSTSWRGKMPLSLTAMCAPGTRGRSARDGSRLGSSRWGFRVFTPMTGAPRAQAPVSSGRGCAP